MLRKHAALALVVLITACGGGEDDNNGNDNNAHNGTTGATGATTGSNGTTGGTTTGSNGTTGSNNSNGRRGAAVAASADFTASAYHWLDLFEQDGDADETTFGSGDIAVAVSGTHGFVLDRTSGLVRVVDAAGQSLGELEAGEGSNPHSAVAQGGRVFVSAYDTGELVVAEDDGGTWSTSALSLESYDDDGNPDPAAMLVDGDHLLVLLQRLTSFMGVENSQLLVLDTTDDTFGAPIDLGVKNAQAGLRAFGDRFAVGATGDFGVNDGGIVALTRSGAGEYEVGELIVSEDDLGGDLLDFIFVSDTEGLAVIGLADFSSQLWAFDTDGNLEQLDGVTSPGFGGLAVSSDGQFVIVGDRDPEAPRFVVFDRLDTTWQTHYAIPTSLPPASVAAY